jgi:hypothetical protein
MSKKSKFKSYDKSGTYAGFTVRTLFDKRGHMKEIGVEKKPGFGALRARHRRVD